MFNNSLSGYSGGSQNLSGVFNFSDGMGTVIEDGTITTNDVYVNDTNITKNNQLATKLYVDLNGSTALLSSNNNWTGNNNFTTQTTSNNSTLVSTTAFVQNNLLNYITSSSLTTTLLNYITSSSLTTTLLNYITSSSLTSTLLNYGGLNLNNSWTGYNIFPTQATSNNSALVATTAYVQNNLLNYVSSSSLTTTLLNYAGLSSNNTFTGANSFNNNTTTFKNSSINSAIIVQSSTISNFIGSHYVAPYGGSFNGIIQAGDYVIFGNLNGGTTPASLTLTTHSSNSVGVRIDDSGTYIYGSSTGLIKFYINSLSPSYFDSSGILNLTYGGKSITPSTADNSTNIATTAYVQNQGYLTSTSLTGYASLSATNSFTNVNTFSQSGSNKPLIIRNSSASNYQGSNFLASSTGFNPIIQANDYVIMGDYYSGLNCSSLTLTTNIAGNLGMRMDSSNQHVDIYGSQITLNNDTTIMGNINLKTTGPIDYSQLGFYINFTTFNSWTTSGTVTNLYTATIDNTILGIKYGTYLVNVQIFVNVPAGAQTTLCLTTASASAINSRWMDFQYNPSAGTLTQILKISKVVQTYSTINLYLNAKCTFTGSISFNTGLSNFEIVRIG